jgi:hypothetical protein
MLRAANSKAKDKTMTTSTGPLVQRLLCAQRSAEESTQHPKIQVLADQLLSLLEELGWPLLWPVDPFAERLVGAAVACGNGKPTVRSFSSTVEGADVLLVAVAAVSSAGLVEAAGCARLLGATVVRGCGVEVPGAEDAVAKGFLRTFSALSAARSEFLPQSAHSVLVGI